MERLLKISVIALLAVAPTASGIMIENPDELPSDWSYEVGMEYIELWEHWTMGQGPVCTVLKNNTDEKIILTVVKNIHNNDPIGLMVDFHNALMVPDGMGGWKSSSEYCDGMYFTGAPGGPCGAPDPPGPNPNAVSSAGWSNIEDPSKDTLDFFAPAGGAGLTFCEWMTISFKVTVPAGMRFNLDQHPTWIPEPATIALLGFGSLALIRRKRKA